MKINGRATAIPLPRFREMVAGFDPRGEMRAKDIWHVQKEGGYHCCAVKAAEVLQTIGRHTRSHLQTRASYLNCPTQ